MRVTVIDGTEGTDRGKDAKKLGERATAREASQGEQAAQTRLVFQLEMYHKRIILAPPGQNTRK